MSLINSKDQELIKIGHDPKGRLVEMTKVKAGFIVTKPVIGFNSGEIKSQEKAISIFNHQVSCSQN
jgi:hypothetical protein